jgi:hypothetical protein
MTLILDAGTLLAFERNERGMWRRLKSALLTAAWWVRCGGDAARVTRNLRVRSTA